MKIVAGNSNLPLARAIADYLGLPLTNADVRRFADDEVFVEIHENVRGEDVFVVQSCYADGGECVDQKLMKLYIMLGSLRDASAGRITAVLPYYPYARQDRKTASRAPVTTKYVSALISQFADRVLAMDVHEPKAIQNAYQIPCDLLEAKCLFADHIVGLIHKHNLMREKIVLMAVDHTGLGRVRGLRKHVMRRMGLDVKNPREVIPLACLDKVHEGASIEGGEGVLGDVSNACVFIYDDMISSGKSILETVKAARQHGAKRVVAACAPHGLFVGNANDYLADPFLMNICTTESIDCFRLNGAVRAKVTQVKSSKFIAEAIHRIHHNESISSLLANGLDQGQITPSGEKFILPPLQNIFHHF